MPRRLGDYDLADWKRLRPLTQTFKTLRYDSANRRHMRKPARVGDISAIVRRLAGQRVFITVAFNDPQAIAWQIVLLRRYVPHDVHLVADNSEDDGVAGTIEKAAAGAGAPYLRLPSCPERSSRGHGLALNWLWRNVVLPGQPEAFGFLDDDLFPTTADDPFGYLTEQDFFGLVRTAGTRWFLWAGFCLFRFAAVREKPLDFRQDWFVGLDTGGRNWDVLYRDAELARLRQPPFMQAPYRHEVPASVAYMQWIGGWLHEVGEGGCRDLAADKRTAVARILATHLARTDG